MLKISNRKLTSPVFWQAFSKISQISEIDLSEKLKIVKLRKLLDDECSAMREVATTSNEEDQRKLLTQDSIIDFHDQIKVPLKLLTADEIFNLEDFLKEEDHG